MLNNSIKNGFTSLAPPWRGPYKAEAAPAIALIKDSLINALVII
jgi:hypothetical protein